MPFIVPLKREGYDPFIDYLKGVSILFVIITHCIAAKLNSILFSLWGAQAVPLFLLIQVFHAYKKKTTSWESYNWGKLFKRIIWPFILLCLIQIVCLLKLPQQVRETYIQDAIWSGGLGPGSYYIWVYLQFYLLLPLVKTLMEKINKRRLLICAVFLCIILEIACSYISIPPWLYRLLMIRYTFLIYLGYTWVKDGVVISIKTILFSLISIVFILLFQYSDINWEPLFINSEWKIFHWVTYFYVAYLFIFILYVIYQILPRIIERLLISMGKYSYEIFLMQMFVFVFFPLNTISKILSIEGEFEKHIIYVFGTLLSSIIPVLLYKKFVEYKNSRKCLVK